MTGWDPSESGPSPNRVDALVWALTELMSGRPPMKISELPLTWSRHTQSLAPMPGADATA